MAGAYSEMQASPGPVGIGGWLILPILGIVVTPIRAFPLIQKYMFVSQMWPSFDRLKAAFFVAEMITDILFLAVLPGVLLVLLLLRKRLFIIMFIFWGVGSLAWNVFDTGLVSWIFRDEFARRGVPFLDSETMQGFARNIVTATIWAPYMALSVRVKHTFVN